MVTNQVCVCVCVWRAGGGGYPEFTTTPKMERLQILSCGYPVRLKAVTNIFLLIVSTKEFILGAQ